MPPVQDRNSYVFSLFQTPAFSYRAGAARGSALDALGELRAKKEDLRRVIDPDEEQYE